MKTRKPIIIIAVFSSIFFICKAGANSVISFIENYNESVTVSEDYNTKTDGGRYWEEWKRAAEEYDRQQELEAQDKKEAKVITAFEEAYNEELMYGSVFVDEVIEVNYDETKICSIAEYDDGAIEDLTAVTYNEQTPEPSTNIGLDIRTDGYVDPAFIEAVRNEIYTYLPDSIIGKLNIPIWILEEDLGAKCGDEPGTVLGMTSYVNGKTIKIEYDTDQRTIDEAVLHEIGHALDSQTYSRTSEWNSIYSCESINAGANNYLISSPAEYFAFAFSEYYKNPNGLSNKAPYSYRYIERFVNEIQNR